MRDWLPVDSGTIPDHIIRKVRTDDLETFKLMREKGLKYEDLSDDQRRYEISSRALRDGEVSLIMVFDYVSGSSFNFQGSSINLSDEVSFGPDAPGFAEAITESDRKSVV